MIPIDLIERLGQAVADGEADLDDAAQQVTEASEGGLTLLGARDSLGRYRTLRREYAAVQQEIHGLPRGCDR